MFRRRNEQSTDSVESYQRSADPATEAIDFIDNALFELELKGIHPWHASDTLQLRFALATTALACDRTAELLLKTGSRRKRLSGDIVASDDVVTFAQNLSANSIQQFKTAKGVIENQTEVTFDETVISELYPENMLPYWPRAFEDGASEESWQSEDEPEVTPEFIKGIIEAGLEFQAHAYSDAQKFTEELQTPVPPEFEGLYPLLLEIMDGAQQELETAQSMLMSDEIDSSVREQAYRYAHDGFIKMMHALVATKTPQVLGIDFLPQR